MAPKHVYIITQHTFDGEGGRDYCILGAHSNIPSANKAAELFCANGGVDQLGIKDIEHGIVNSRYSGSIIYEKEGKQTDIQVEKFDLMNIIRAGTKGDKKSSAANNKKAASSSPPDADPEDADESDDLAVPIGAANCLKGRIISFTGELSTMTRKEASTLAEKYGAEVKNTVTKTVNLVVLGDKTGPKKLAQAQKAGIQQVDEPGFLRLIKMSPAGGQCDDEEEDEDDEPPKKRSKRTHAAK